MTFKTTNMKQQSTPSTGHTPGTMEFKEWDSNKIRPLFTIHCNGKRIFEIEKQYWTGEERINEARANAERVCKAWNEYDILKAAHIDNLARLVLTDKDWDENYQGFITKDKIGYLSITWNTMEVENDTLKADNDTLRAANKELLKTIEHIGRSAENINEHTWKTYKEQILLHVNQELELSNHTKDI